MRGLYSRHWPCAKQRDAVRILDAGITYVNNTGGSHVVKFDDGVAYGNRFGLKGTEDLGGGLKAVFTLESGFHLGNGQLGFGGAEFGRQAYVGLQNDWGTLSFGNQLDITNGSYRSTTSPRGAAAMRSTRATSTASTAIACRTR